MTKTWFITGASSGFGRQLAELLLQRGDRVAATVRKGDALKDLAATYGDRLWVGVLDVADAVAVRTVIDRAFTELKRIDIVVSNAGYALFGASEEVADAQIERQFDTNLLGSIHVARERLTRMLVRIGARPERPILVERTIVTVTYFNQGQFPEILPKSTASGLPRCAFNDMLMETVPAEMEA